MPGAIAAQPRCKGLVIRRPVVDPENAHAQERRFVMPAPQARARQLVQHPVAVRPDHGEAQAQQQIPKVWIVTPPERAIEDGVAHKLAQYRERQQLADLLHAFAAR